MAVYRCKRCQYIYNEEHQQKKFEELNDANFKCPRCKCSKKLFEKIG